MIVAHVSTFPPLKCGIASFATDLIGAIPDFHNLKYSLHYGIKGQENYHGNANVNSPESLIELAKLISNSDCDIVSLQHEFGIWGGREGENIFHFLDNLSKPIISTLHTTFGPMVKGPIQREIIAHLIDRSVCVVLLTDFAKLTTEKLLGCQIKNIVVIPHGIPDYPYQDPPPLLDKDSSSPFRLITPGFFRDDKGIDVILLALHELKLRGYNILYKIAGEPQNQFPDQRKYRAKIENLVDSLSLRSIVEIDARYLSVDEQVSAIQGCHLGIFAYQNQSQSSSGTIPLVLSVGRPALCTPFEYAKARKGFGITITTDFDHLAIADSIEKFIACNEYLDIARDTYKRTREWTWDKVGLLFAAEYRKILAQSYCG